MCIMIRILSSMIVSMKVHPEPTGPATQTVLSLALGSGQWALAGSDLEPSSSCHGTQAKRHAT